MSPEAVPRRLEVMIAAVACGGAVAIGGAAAGIGVAQSAERGGGFFVGAFAAWVIVCLALWRDRASNVVSDPAAAPLPDFTAATWITVGRALLISAVAGFLLGPSPGETAAWIAGGLYTLAAIGDTLDGWVARRTGTPTPWGAMVDVRVDALGLLVAPLLAVAWGRLPVWYLLLAAAYPVFQATVWLRGRLGLPTFRDRLRPDPRARFFAGVQMAVVAAALFPVLPLAVMGPLATVAMVPTLLLFVGEWRVVTGRSAAPAQAEAQRLHV